MQNGQIIFEDNNMARDSFMGNFAMCNSKGNAEIDRYSRIVKGNGELEDYIPAQGKRFPQYVMVGKTFYSQEPYKKAPYDKILEMFPVEKENVQLPVYIDTRANANILVEYNESGLTASQEFAHNVMWGFLTEIPVFNLNISVFDCEKRGTSVTPFLEFRKKAPDIFDGKIYTEKDEVYSRLKSYNAEIDERIQSKLGTKYVSMTEYNQQNPMFGEQVHLLVVNDFPCGFTAESMDLLINILKNGNKCGIYTVINYNRDIPFTGYEKLETYIGQIKELSNVWEVKNNQCYSPDFAEPLSKGALLPDSMVKEFAEGYINRWTAAKEQGFSISNILDKNLFERTSESSLFIPMGIGDDGATVELELGKRSSHHALIVGATGSGKSTLLHTLILSAMLHYKPDELNLYLMDFKSGTEFKIYETCRLPHIKLLALDAMQEFGESILEDLVNEMTRRSEKFKDVGATKLGEYVRMTGTAMPRILVVMDEFQVLFNESQNRKLAYNCAELTKKIVTEGRSFGIHLIMATQSTKVISELSLSAGIIEQMRIRIGLKCSEDDARYLFGENSSKVPEMMKGSMGTAVLNPEYTESDINRFRVAYCDDELMNHILKVTEEEFGLSEYTMQTFEGKRVKKLLECYDSQTNKADNNTKINVLIGELIKVAPPLELVFDKKRKHNIVICGSGEKMTDNLLNVLLLGVLENSKSKVYCMDGDIFVDEEAFLPFYRQYERFEGQFHLAETYGDIVDFVHEIHDAYKQRKKKKDDTTIFVVIRNLQYLELVKRMLKGEFIDESEYMDDSDAGTNAMPSEDDFFDFGLASGTASSQGLAEMFLKLVKEGTAYGIHFILSCNEFQTIKENMYYGENVLSQFPERFVFDLSDNDANMLIDNVSVATLGENAVYYSDGVKTICQVKPYRFPTVEELEVYLSREPQEQQLQMEEISGEVPERTGNLTGRERLRALCGETDIEQGMGNFKKQEDLSGEMLFQTARMFENGWGVRVDSAEAVKYFKYAVEYDNAEAMYNLGKCYADGRGVSKNLEKAAYWYEKAAECGHVIAMTAISSYYTFGLGVAKDESKAFIWNLKSAVAGNNLAMYDLGICYERGRGVSKNEERAAYWYEASAKAGYREAFNAIGCCYETGRGVAKDERKAFMWYEKAANAGDATAMYKLAVCYEEGRGVTKNLETAEEWFEAAARKGEERAIKREVHRLIEDEMLSYVTYLELEWCKKIAASGDVKVMRFLAEFYNSPGPDQNFHEATKWYKKAAEAGDTDAMKK